MPITVPHLSEANRRTLRGLLVERAQRLERELRATPPEEPACAGDGERQVLADLRLAVQLAIDERDVRELHLIEEALARLDGGTYGLCVECGSRIAWARLQANPETLRCVRCDGIAERRTAASPYHSF